MAVETHEAVAASEVAVQLESQESPKTQATDEIKETDKTDKAQEPQEKQDPEEEQRPLSRDGSDKDTVCLTIICL